MKKITLKIVIVLVVSNLLEAYNVHDLQRLRSQITLKEKPSKANVAAANKKSIYLPRADFRGIGEVLKKKFGFINFSYANLSGALFGPCVKTEYMKKIRGYIFSILPADLTGYNFSFANLRNSSFENAILVNANFEGADVAYANFTNADLRGAAFKNVQNIELAVFCNVKKSPTLILPKQSCPTNKS